MRCDNSSVEFGGFRDGLCSACATLVPTTLLGHIGDCMLLLPLCKCALLGREGYHACVVALVSTKPCLRTVEKQTSSGDAAERAQHERSDDTACLAPMCATLSLTHPCYVPVAMVPRRAASATDRHTTASDSHHKDCNPKPHTTRASLGPIASTYNCVCGMELQHTKRWPRKGCDKNAPRATKCRLSPPQMHHLALSLTWLAAVIKDRRVFGVVARKALFQSLVGSCVVDYMRPCSLIYSLVPPVNCTSGSWNVLHDQE